MEKKYFLLAFSLLSIVFLVQPVSAVDIQVWQGKYLTGQPMTTYTFVFTVYDDILVGDSCWTNSVDLTTDSDRWWYTDQVGILETCGNSSKNYYLNIEINGADQAPRRLLKQLKYADMSASNNIFSGEVSVYDLIVRSGESISLAGATFENEGHYTSVDTNWIVEHDDSPSAFIGVYANNGSIMSNAHLILESGGSSAVFTKNSPLHPMSPNSSGWINEDGNIGFFVEHTEEIIWFHFDEHVKDAYGNIVSLQGAERIMTLNDDGLNLSNGIFIGDGSGLTNLNESNVNVTHSVNGSSLNVLDINATSAVFNGNVNVGGTIITESLIVNDGMSVDGNHISQHDDGIYIGGIKLEENLWEVVNPGQNWIKEVGQGYWQSVAMSSTGKYQSAVAYSKNITISSDYGETWTETTSGAKEWYGIAMSSDGKYQTAMVLYNDAFISSDYGVTWTDVGHESNGAWDDVAMSSDGQIQVGTQGGIGASGYIHISYDYGNTWTQTGNEGYWQHVAISSDGKYISAVEPADKIYRSDDYGETWTRIGGSGSLLQWKNIAMSADGRYQTAVNENSDKKVFVSSDYGLSFQWKGLTRGAYAVAMSSDGRIQIIGVSNYDPSDYSIYLSEDYGQTWTQLPGTSESEWTGLAMSSDGMYMIGAVDSDGIFVSQADYEFAGDILIDGDLNVTGDIELAGNLYTDTTFYLFDGEFGRLGYTTTQTLIISSNASKGLIVDNIDIRSVGTFRPSANNTYDLGTIANPWKNLFISGNVNASYYFGNGSGFTSLNWLELFNVPSGFADSIDNDTTYSHLSNFTDNLGNRGYTVLSNFSDDLGNRGYAFLSNFTDDLGNRGYTLLSNFTDNLGNRGYTSLSNFTNDAGFVAGNHTIDTNRSDAEILGVCTVYNDTAAIEFVNTSSNIESLGFVQGLHTIDTNRTDAEILSACSIYNISGTAIDVTEVYNSAGDLKIMPDVQGDVILFGDTDVDNAVDGNEIRIKRNAQEGNDYIRFYITKSEGSMIHSDADIRLQNADGKDILLNSGRHVYLNLGDQIGNDELKIRDVAGLEVGTVDSNGNVWYRGDLSIGVSSDVLIQANGDSYFNGGDVGIGTTDPDYALHLFRTNEHSVLQVEANGSDHGEANLFFKTQSDPGWQIFMADSNLSVLGEADRLGFYHYGSAANRMVIDGSSGNVGIGTNDPEQMLHVNGSIKTNEAIISDNFIGVPVYFTCGENSNLSYGYQWSCGGNGEVGSNLGIFAFENLTITNLGLACTTGTGTAIINMTLDNVNTTCSITSTDTSDTSACNLDVTSGQRMLPFTISDTGHSQCVITMKAVTR